MLLDLLPHVECITEKGGQDTAHTILAAWDKMIPKPSHLWIHPVDLPLVLPRTISLLHRKSEESPSKTLRPVCENKPGHPVIMPAKCLDILHSEYPGPLWHPGPVRTMISGAVGKGLIDPLQDVGVDDPAVTKDFDCLQDVKKGP